MDGTTASQDQVVVYYWTNLALLEQGQGLEQQKQDFENWHASSTVPVAAEFTDTFLKRTKPKHFPELAKAVNYCLANNAKLIVVKLNGLIGQKEFADLLATANLNFQCLDKNLVTPQVLSVVRQYVEEQSRQHGNSIKRGLRLTTKNLGNPNAAKAISPFNQIKTENAVMFALLLQPVVIKLQKDGLSQRKMVTALNEAGIVAPEGGKWVLSQLQKVLKRIDTNTLALNLSEEIKLNNYGDYSPVDLIAALNQGDFKPTNQELWDEDTLKSLQNRNRTIKNVINLYEFMQAQGDYINQYINQGKTLTEIAEILTNKGAKVPKAILQASGASVSGEMWTDKTVEEIIKRMNNALQLPYSNVVVEDFCKALEDYAGAESNSLAREVYSNQVLRNLLTSSEQSPGNNNSSFNS